MVGESSGAATNDLHHQQEQVTVSACKQVSFKLDHRPSEDIMFSSILLSLDLK